jgi:hypothetical protein
MTVFEPRVVVAWFATFFALFFGFLIIGFFIPALVTIVVFGAVFAAAYHLYTLMPGRKEENERFIREWRAHLEKRWGERPTVARSVTYYMRRAPFEPSAAIGLLVVLVALILIIALVTIYLPSLLAVLSRLH